MGKPSTLLLFSLFLWCSCQQGKENRGQEEKSVIRDSTAAKLPPKQDPVIGQYGKIQDEKFLEIYRPSALDTLPVPIISNPVLEVIDQQEQLLSTPGLRKNHRIGNLSFHISDLTETLRILRSRQHTLPVDLPQLLDAHQIWGQDRMGNVLFTGYFTPILKVREKPDAEYKYPIFDRPKNWEGPLPTRRQIEGEGALDSLGLEIAYAKSKVDLYYMQVQGSGFVEFPDGRRVLLSYNGSNRHPYRSIEKYMASREDWAERDNSIGGIKKFLNNNPHLQDSLLFHNPSYIFFQPRFTEPKGAGNVPLTGGFSIAVDKRYIPLGSCLLAAIPIFDRKAYRVIGHEYRIVFAQDVGGRIKGPGHIDFYFGTGPEARRAASRMRHYGRLWLLLPKKDALLFSMQQ